MYKGNQLEMCVALRQLTRNETSHLEIFQQLTNETTTIVQRVSMTVTVRASDECEMFENGKNHVYDSLVLFCCNTSPD